MGNRSPDALSPVRAAERTARDHAAAVPDHRARHHLPELVARGVHQHLVRTPSSLVFIEFTLSFVLFPTSHPCAQGSRRVNFFEGDILRPDTDGIEDLFFHPSYLNVFDLFSCFKRSIRGCRRFKNKTSRRKGRIHLQSAKNVQNTPESVQHSWKLRRLTLRRESYFPQPRHSPRRAIWKHLETRGRTHTNSEKMFADTSF